MRVPTDFEEMTRLERALDREQTDLTEDFLSREWEAEDQAERAADLARDEWDED